MVRVIFLQLFEQYKKGEAYAIERTLANGLCKRGICVPFTVHQRMLKEAEQKVIEAEEKKKAEEKAEKEKADEERKADLLKKKVSEEAEKADSKKPTKAEKSVKK